MGESAELRIGNETYSLPIIEGSEGERAVDIGKLRSESGLITLDPGYGNTGSCTSEITFINGEQGILRYRGYPIEALAEHSSFLEVAYLLIQGELPTKEQLDTYRSSIRYHTMLHEDFKRFLSALPKDAHPMAACSAAIAALATVYPDSLAPRDPPPVRLVSLAASGRAACFEWTTDRVHALRIRRGATEIEAILLERLGG